MTQGVDLNALWKYVTDKVKGQITLPGLWRAMEAAHPLALENDELVLGYSGKEAHQRGLLLDQRHRNIIEQTLFAATRKQLALRVIEGESLADWETYKAQQAEAARLQAESRQKYQQELAAGSSWDTVGEQLIRQLSGMPHRNLASVQGRFLAEAVPALAEAYGKLVSDPPTEQEERNYSRALERLAERSGVPSAVIAYLVQERLARVGAGEG